MPSCDAGTPPRRAAACLPAPSVGGDENQLPPLVACGICCLQVCRFRRFVFLDLRGKFFLKNGTRVALQALWGVVGFQKFRLLGQSDLRNLYTCDLDPKRCSCCCSTKQLNCLPTTGRTRKTHIPKLQVLALRLKSREKPRQPPTFDS